MEKQTNIFGFDRTPRKALWAEIEQQNKQIQSLMAERSSSKQNNDKLVRGLEITLEIREKSLKEAERLLVKRNKEIAILQEKLSRYNRHRDKSGKFTKTK